MRINRSTKHTPEKNEGRKANNMPLELINLLTNEFGNGFNRNNKRNWIMVPEGWSRTTLAEILDGSIKNGYSPNAAKVETGYWVLGLGALGDNGININEIKPVSPTDKVLRNQLQSGDFLVSRSNTPDKVGRSILYKGEISNCSYPDLMMRFRINESKAKPEFIESKLRSSSVRNYFKKCAAGSSHTMVKINKSIIENTPLLLPPLPEQIRIANVLTKWDKAIELTEKLIEKNRTLKTGLMQLLLTGKKRFPGFNEEWKEVTLSSIANITMGSSPKSEAYNKNKDGLPLLQGNADIKNRESAPRMYTTQITKTCDIGDVLLSVRAPVGEVAISKHKACIGRGIASITAKSNSDNKFIYQALLYKEPFWSKISQGSTFDCVNSSDIKKLHIFSPGNKDERVMVSNTLEKQDIVIKLLIAKHELLTLQKKGLMQLLLTGKLRVKVDANE